MDPICGSLRLVSPARPSPASSPTRSMRRVLTGSSLAGIVTRLHPIRGLLTGSSLAGIVTRLDPIRGLLTGSSLAGIVTRYRVPVTVALLTDKYELTMLQAALRDGSAHRRTTFELFARRLPDGRRYGVVAGTGRFLEALPRFRFDDAALRITDRIPRRADPGFPPRLPVRRRRRRLRGGRAVLPELARALGAGQFRRVRPAGDARAVDLQPRHRDRVGRGAHGQRRRGTPADRDGIAAYARVGRGGRRTGRLRRRFRRLIESGGQPQLRCSGAGHQCACVHHAAHLARRPRRAGRVPHAGRGAGCGHHAAGRHL